MSKTVEIIKKKDLPAKDAPEVSLFNVALAKVETRNALKLIEMYKKLLPCAEYQSFLTEVWLETHKIVSPVS